MGFKNISWARVFYSLLIFFFVFSVSYIWLDYRNNVKLLALQQKHYQFALNDMYAHMLDVQNKLTRLSKSFNKFSAELAEMQEDVYNNIANAQTEREKLLSSLQTMQKQVNEWQILYADTLADLIDDISYFKEETLRQVKVLKDNQVQLGSVQVNKTVVPGQESLVIEEKVSSK